MTTDSMPHWAYFCALTSDLESVHRYVDFSSANYETYSIEFVRLLLAFGAEADVVAKVLCHKIDATCKVNNIKQYREIIVTKYPLLPEMSVHAAKYGLEFNPWKDWLSDTSPIWWKAYNNVKHLRNTHYKHATLQNTLSSAAGLYILLYYLYAETLLTSSHETTFMSLPSKFIKSAVGHVTHRYKLPDYQYA